MRLVSPKLYARPVACFIRTRKKITKKKRDTSNEFVLLKRCLIPSTYPLPRITNTKEVSKFKEERDLFHFARGYLTPREIVLLEISIGSQPGEATRANLSVYFLTLNVYFQNASAKFSPRFDDEAQLYDADNVARVFERASNITPRSYCQKERSQQPNQN